MIRRNGAELHIASGIREFARATPAATAIVDGGRSLTYRSLDERANRVAQSLLARGIQPGDRVAVLLGNRLEYPEIAAGLAKAGMPMVPVNPRLTAPEVAFITDHSNTAAVIVDAALADLLDWQPETCTLIVDSDYETALEAASTTDPDIEVAETDPFCVAYTSGTTGRPKGVMISHRSRCLTFYGTALEWGLGPGRRTIAVAPMYHGAGFAFAYAALHTGGTVSMLRAFDPERLLAMIANDRPHTVFLVPTHAQMLRSLGDDVVGKADTSSLETLYFNAAPLPQELKLWVLDAFPHVGVHELYGSTEAGIVSNLRPADMRRKERCVGPPWFMTEVRVVGDDGEVVGAGGTGELFSRSPYLMNGYLDDPSATAACTTEDGFLTSGDVVQVDDEGYLYVVDRKKDLIISGGVNVYPREVEEVLATHPSIVEAAVVGQPDETWGEAVRAFVTLTPGAALDASELDRHCRASLAGFKVPRGYTVIDAIPRNAAGKVLKTDLRSRL